MIIPIEIEISKGFGSGISYWDVRCNAINWEKGYPCDQINEAQAISKLALELSREFSPERWAYEITKKLGKVNENSNTD